MLRAQDPGAARDPAVSLPAFIVQGITWRYVHPPGFEILSRWSDSTTRDFTVQLLAARQLFDAVLPSDLQAQFSVPTTYLLVPQGMIDALPGPLRTQVLAHAPITGAATGARATEIRFLPNLMLSDRDALAIFALQTPESTRLIFTTSRVRLALERRVPALPHWFIDGFCELYSGMGFSRGVAATSQTWWFSREKTDALRTDPEMPRELMPLAELFANPPAGGPDETPAHAALRNAEASLFIRWALDGEGSPRRAALWRFVSDAAAGPITEHRFEELFKEDYFSALNDISDYLPWAVAHSLRVAPSQAPVDSDIRLRDATPAEVGRIKGDWERLEMNRVALQFPELVPTYREHAQQTFNLAYQDDKSDPGLLAAMGLFDVDCGNPALADPLLRAAAASHIVRPRVYYELVRLLFAELIKAQPDATRARLNPIQASTLLELLSHARSQAPELPEVYGLYFQVSLAAAVQPTPALLQVFREGVRLFPENPELIYEAAVMLVRGGYMTEANLILQQGTGLSAPKPLRSRMATLQEALVAALGAHTGTTSEN